MYRHKLDEAPSDIVVLHWFLLSFNGGAINAGGFLATGRFVSHVTGFATLFGVDLMSSQVEAAIGILTVPLFFLAGAFFAGLLIDRPLHLGRRPHYDWVMGLCAACLFLTGFGEYLGFGKFGDLLDLRSSYLFLALLCMASGLQNATITSSSRGSVRTTHMTGHTTDLGLGLARLTMWDAHKEKYKKERRAIQLRIGSILSFVLGSAVGAFVFLKLGFPGFALPGLIAAYAAWRGHREANESVTM